MRPGGRLRRNHGAGGGLGAERRRMGNYSSLLPLRGIVIEPGGSGRQSHETYEHCYEAYVLSAVSIGAH